MATSRDTEELSSREQPPLPEHSHTSTQADAAESGSIDRELPTDGVITCAPEKVSGFPAAIAKERNITGPLLHERLPIRHPSFNTTLINRQGPNSADTINVLPVTSEELQEHPERNSFGKRPGTLLERNFSPTQHQQGESASELIKPYVSPPQSHFPNISSPEDTMDHLDGFSDSGRFPFGTCQVPQRSETKFQGLSSTRRPSISQYTVTSHNTPASQFTTPGSYRSHVFLSPSEDCGYGLPFDDHYNRAVRYGSTPYNRQRSSARDDRGHIHKNHSEVSNMHIRRGSATVSSEEYDRGQSMILDNYSGDQNQHRRPFIDLGNGDFVQHYLRDPSSYGSGTRTGQEHHNITRRRSQLSSPIFSNGKTSGRQSSHANTELPTSNRNPWGGSSVQMSPSARTSVSQSRPYYHGSGGHSVRTAPSIRQSFSQPRPNHYGSASGVNGKISSNDLQYLRNVAHPLSSEASATMADDEEDESIEEILRRNRPRVDVFNTPPAFNRTETLDFEGSRLRKTGEHSRQQEIGNRTIQNESSIGRSHDIITRDLTLAHSATEVVDLTTPVNSGYSARRAPVTTSHTRNSPTVSSSSRLTHKQAEIEKQAAERIALLEKQARRARDHDDLFEEPLEDEEANARIKKSAELDIGKKRIKEKAELIDGFQRKMAEALMAKQKQEEQEDLERRRAERKKKTTTIERKRREEIEAERLETKRIQSLKFSDRERRRHEAIMAKAEEDAKREAATSSFGRASALNETGTGKDKPSEDNAPARDTDMGLFIQDDEGFPNQVAESRDLSSFNGAGCEVDVEKTRTKEHPFAVEHISEDDKTSGDRVSRQELSATAEVPTRPLTLVHTGSTNEVVPKLAPRASNITQTTKKTSFITQAQGNRQRTLGKNSQSSIPYQQDIANREFSSRARKGWVIARETERVERQYQQVVENERKEVEKLQEELLAQEEQRQRDWEKQQEQRNHEWEAQMSQMAQMEKLVGDKTEAIFEMALEKAFAKVAATIPVSTGSQSDGMSQNSRPPTLNSTVTFVSQAVAQAEEKRKAEEARLKKFVNDKRKIEKRYERDIRKTLESQGMEQDEEKIRNTMEEKMQQWEERRRKKELKILGGNNECSSLSMEDHQNGESSPATVHETDESGTDSGAAEAKRRETIIRAGVSFLASMNNTSKDFANAAAKQRVEFLDSDDSEESEEDPDDEPEASQKPTAEGNILTTERDADGDVNMDLRPDDVNHRVLPQILPTSVSSAAEPQRLPNQIADYSEVDMIHTYKVRHLRERNGEVEPHVVIQTFHSLGEANAFAAQQLGNLYLSINQALTGRSEMHDADNLYLGKITIQDQPDWAEIIYVTREISYVGDIVDLQRTDVQPIIHPKVFNVIKEVVQTNRDLDVIVVACTSIKILANKLAANEYLALAKPISANMDLVTHYHEVVVPDVRARLDLADELGEIVDLEPAENLDGGLSCFRVSVSENAVRGPLN